MRWGEGCFHFMRERLTSRVSSSVKAFDPSLAARISSSVTLRSLKCDHQSPSWTLELCTTYCSTRSREISSIDSCACIISSCCRSREKGFRKAYRELLLGRLRCRWLSLWQPNRLPNRFFSFNLWHCLEWTLSQSKWTKFSRVSPRAREQQQRLMIAI